VVKPHPVLVERVTDRRHWSKAKQVARPEGVDDPAKPGAKGVLRRLVGVLGRRLVGHGEAEHLLVEGAGTGDVGDGQADVTVTGDGGIGTLLSRSGARNRSRQNRATVLGDQRDAQASAVVELDTGHHRDALPARGRRRPRTPADQASH